MAEIQFMRESDNVTTTHTPAPIELCNVAGRWSSSETQSRGIASIELKVRDGAVEGHAFGAVHDGLVDWGTTRVTALFTDGACSNTFAGFRLRYELDMLTSHVQANLKLGVMVLGVYQTFRGDSSRSNYFFREFLAVTESGSAPPIAAPGDRCCSHDDGLGSSTPALELLLGSWTNTNPGSLGITGIDLEASGGGQVLMRVFGAGTDGPIDWGETTGQVFTCSEEDAVPSAAALAHYEFGFFDCELQIRQNKGILAVTTFNRFHDGSGRHDYVSRELFHRSEKS